MDNKNDASVKALTISRRALDCIARVFGFSLRDGLQVWEQRGGKSRANVVHQLKCRLMLKDCSTFPSVFLGSTA